MNTIRRLGGLFWVLAIGVVVLYAFFVTLNAFAPGDVWWVTAGVAVLVALLAVHLVHVRRELAKGGQSSARRELNAMREKRGF